MIAKKSAALLLITLLATSTYNHCWNEPEWVTRLVFDLDACKRTGRAMLKLHSKLCIIDEEFLASDPDYKAGPFERLGMRLDEKSLTISGVANKISKENQGVVDWQNAIKRRDERRAQAVQSHCNELLASPLFSAAIHARHGIDVLTQCKATESVEIETKQDDTEVNS